MGAVGTDSMDTAVVETWPVAAGRLVVAAAAWPLVRACFDAGPKHRAGSTVVVVAVDLLAGRHHRQPPVF